MNKFDVVKVMNAGFKVFRLPRFGYKEWIIFEASGKGGWKQHGKFPSFAAANRAFSELMKNPKHLEG